MTSMTLGKRIASRRKLIGLSQEALAEHMNVSRQAVSKWESDITIPEIDKLLMLSKLFKVNVGWLLGVEADINACSDFTEQQLTALEQMLRNYQRSSKISWIRYPLFGILIIAIALAAFIFSKQITRLKEGNAQSIEQITALSADNIALKNQLENVNNMLTIQAEKEQLLTEDFKIEAHADEGIENVSIVLYLRPKIYQESNHAIISISNPISRYHNTIDCVWSPHNQLYIARFTIPVADDYKFTFILVNEYGYEEENLIIRDTGFAELGTYCSFYIDPTNDHSSRMKRKEPYYWSLSENDGFPAIYEFNVPIYTPHIFAKTAVAYQDIRILLKHNGEVVWEQSYLNNFYEAAGGIFLNAKDVPVYPMIRIPFPVVTAGDALELYLEAQTCNGSAITQKYCTLLDYHIIKE